MAADRRARRRDGAEPRDLRTAVAGRAPGTELPERVRALDVEQRLDVPRAGRAGCGRRALVRDAQELGVPAAGRHACRRADRNVERFVCSAFRASGSRSSRSPAAPRAAEDRRAHRTRRVRDRGRVYGAGLTSRRLARWAGNLSARIVSWGLRIFRRGPVSWTGETFAGFRAQAVGLLRRRWYFLTAATLAGQLTVFLVLLACLRVFDVPPGQVSVIEAFAAWSLIRLLGSVPITPGGLGIVELGLTTALVGFGGGNAQVVTAVLVYRFLTIVPTLLLGCWRARPGSDTARPRRSKKARSRPRLSGGAARSLRGAARSSSSRPPRPLRRGGARAARRRTR